ncbi:hypothetical protein [Variovorax sp. EL159]|uniref:T6SS immunity protein Tli3 family protein n=1 Tax=Variovorax sp. EL159 TaxID=1566270 RepID=UPI0008891F0E|nr:hypothetical protein [Variovorax sp. EL159]SCX56026.1 hypothetical protein SAMN03159363_1639 [Variovorax sp. EL159]
MSNLDFTPAWRLAFAALALALGACTSGGASTPPPTPGAFIPPQVAYRIDDHRYFEITPWPDGECTDKILYFVDTAKGIRSKAVKWDNVMTQGKLIIDADNDQYLVAPVTRGSINCSSGGGICGERLPYSVDGGKTWGRAWYPGYGDDLMISGSTVYRSYRIQTIHTDSLDLTEIPTPKSTNWKSIRDFVSKPQVPPVDTKVLCKANDSGSRK